MSEALKDIRRYAISILEDLLLDCTPEQRSTFNETHPNIEALLWEEIQRAILCVEFMVNHNKKK